MLRSDLNLDLILRVLECLPQGHLGQEILSQVCSHVCFGKVVSRYKLQAAPAFETSWSWIPYKRSAALHSSNLGLNFAKYNKCVFLRGN